MKIKVTKEWCVTMASLEENSEIGAGQLAMELDPRFFERHESDSQEVDNPRVAFGQFVSALRRRMSLTIEQLSDDLDVDTDELVLIERDVDYTPEPRTIHRLAKTFNIPIQRLLQLSGLATSKDPHLYQEAVRFAARSASIERLTNEETVALESFVRFLSESPGVEDEEN